MKNATFYNLVKFSAMAIGLLSSLFFLLFLVGEGVGDFLDGKTGAVPILIMMLFAVLGFVISWFKVRIGAVMMIIGALIMGAYLLAVGESGNLLMALAFSVPFLVPGIMMMCLKKLSGHK